MSEQFDPHGLLAALDELGGVLRRMEAAPQIYMTSTYPQQQTYRRVHWFIRQSLNELNELDKGDKVKEYEMNAMNLKAVAVQRIEFVRDRDTDKLYLRFRLDDGAIVLMPVSEGTEFVTASVLFR